MHLYLAKKKKKSNNIHLKKQKKPQIFQHLDKPFKIEEEKKTLFWEKLVMVPLLRFLESLQGIIYSQVLKRYLIKLFILR